MIASITSMFVFMRVLVLVGMAMGVGVFVGVRHTVVRMFVPMGMRVRVLVIMSVFVGMAFAHGGLLSPQS
jgi:hypothetical protein